jgi:hypothetical protein
MLIFIPDNVISTEPKIRPRIYKYVEEGTESAIGSLFLFRGNN